MKFISIADYAKIEGITSRAVYKRISSQKIYATEIEGKKYIIEENDPVEIEKIVYAADTKKVSELEYQLKQTETTLEALKDENTNLHTQIERKPQIEYVEKEIEVYTEVRKTSWVTYLIIFLFVGSLIFNYLLIVSIQEKDKKKDWFEENNITIKYNTENRYIYFPKIQVKEFQKDNNNNSVIWFK